MNMMTAIPFVVAAIGGTVAQAQTDLPRAAERAPRAAEREARASEPETVAKTRETRTAASRNRTAMRAQSDEDAGAAEDGAAAPASTQPSAAPIRPVRVLVRERATPAARPFFQGPFFQGKGYIAVSAGYSFQQESNNIGYLSRALTVTGTETELDGAVAPAGLPIGWETDFDRPDNWNLDELEDPNAYAAAFGYDMGETRLELEIAFAKADVDTHGGLGFGRVLLDGVDAAILDEAQMSPTGITVGQALSNGTGQLKTSYAMFNVFRDFENRSPLTPFIGGGIGAGLVNVTYAPSGLALIEDEQTAFAAQGMVGVALDLGERVSVVGTARYRGTKNVEFDTMALPARIEVENQALSGEIGLRLSF